MANPLKIIIDINDKANVKLIFLHHELKLLRLGEIKSGGRSGQIRKHL